MVEVYEEVEQEVEEAFFCLHLLYAGEPKAGSCPATSYISLLANVRPDSGRLLLEEEEFAGGGGGASTAGVSSELQHAEGALARIFLASSIASSSPPLDAIELEAATAKVLLSMLR